MKSEEPDLVRIEIAISQAEDTFKNIAFLFYWQMPAHLRIFLLILLNNSLYTDFSIRERPYTALMPKPPYIFSDKEQLRSRDTRIGLLILCALVLWSVLSYRIHETDGYSVASGLTLQLASEDGKLFFAKAELPQGKNKKDLRKLAPPLTPFFFQPIPVNFANAELIETINGIGPHLAEEIVRTRNAHGLFSKADDLMGVSGLGPKRISQLENQFSFQTNL